MKLPSALAAFCLALRRAAKVAKSPASLRGAAETFSLEGYGSNIGYTLAPLVMVQLKMIPKRKQNKQDLEIVNHVPLKHDCGKNEYSALVDELLRKHPNIYSNSSHYESEYKIYPPKN